VLFTAQTDVELVSDGAAGFKFMLDSLFPELLCIISEFVPVKIESPHYAAESGQW